jgi:hypothetical protein
MWMRRKKLTSRHFDMCISLVGSGEHNCDMGDLWLDYTDSVSIFWNSWMKIEILTLCFRRRHSVQEVKVRVRLLLLKLEPDPEPLA